MAVAVYGWQTPTTRHFTFSVHWSSIITGYRVLLCSRLWQYMLWVELNEPSWGVCVSNDHIWMNNILCSRQNIGQYIDHIGGWRSFIHDSWHSSTLIQKSWSVSVQWKDDWDKAILQSHIHSVYHAKHSRCLRQVQGTHHALLQWVSETSTRYPSCTITNGYCQCLSQIYAVKGTIPFNNTMNVWLKYIIDNPSNIHHVTYSIWWLLICQEMRSSFCQYSPS